MIDPATYAAYVAACFAIVLVPGPTVTLIIANALRHGARAGLANVAGTQAGLALMLLILALGFSALVAIFGAIFDWIRLAGAAYLVWLGVRLWRARGRSVEGDGPPPAPGFFWQGLLVALSNPKVLLFFGAFIPQFVDPSQSTLGQSLILGATFMLVATVCDGAYALAAARAGGFLSRRRVVLLERMSGSLLIAGGMWLALSRRG